MIEQNQCVNTSDAVITVDESLCAYILSQHISLCCFKVVRERKKPLVTVQHILRVLLQNSPTLFYAQSNLEQVFTASEMHCSKSLSGLT